RSAPLVLYRAPEPRRFTQRPRRGFALSVATLVTFVPSARKSPDARPGRRDVHSPLNSARFVNGLCYRDHADRPALAPATLTASSRARSPPICRCRHRPSTTWSSISRLPRRSASKFRHRYSPAPTRRSNEAPRVHHACRWRGCDGGRQQEEKRGGKSCHPITKLDGATFSAVAARRFSAASSPHCWEALSQRGRRQSPATSPRSTEPPFA